MCMPVVLPFFPLLTAAQDLPNSVFWRITRADVTDTSYVLGTVHSADARAFSHAALPVARIPPVDAVVGELDLRQERSEGMSLWKEMQLPKGTYLDGFY